MKDEKKKKSDFDPDKFSEEINQIFEKSEIDESIIIYRRGSEFGCNTRCDSPMMLLGLAQYATIEAQGQVRRFQNDQEMHDFKMALMKMVADREAKQKEEAPSPETTH